MGNSCGCCVSSGKAAMSPTHPQPVTQPTHSSEDSIMLLIKDVDPIQHIDPLINFIENLIIRMKAPTEVSTSSSGGIQVESVASRKSLAAQIFDKISTEAQNFVHSETAKAIGSTAISAAKVIGETHWIFVGLSIAAFALERCVTVTSNVEECRELLQTIAEAAKDLKKFKEAVPGEAEKVGKAVTVVAEGAFTCCHYIDKCKASRYWSATIMENELRKTRERVREVAPSLALATVTHIIRNLTRRSLRSPLNLLDFKPVGIEKQISEVKDLLDMEGSDPALAVILCGFGGVGKTTLAASVIQKLDWDSADFKFCRVIIDEKKRGKTSHILELQRNIILDLAGEKFDLRDTDDGRQQIKRVMESKCCFLFIDNVVDSDCIKQLLPKHLLPASKNSKIRILITSRGSDLRPVLQIKKCKEYDVNTLSDEAARSLLRNTILEDGTEAPHRHFDEEGLMNQVAELSRGVPLLLSVYGNQLKLERAEGRAVKSYHDALKALQTGELNSFASEEQLAEKLLYVYRKMDEEDQQAFLDICVYFHGKKWDFVGNCVDERKLEAFRRRMLLSRTDAGDEVIVHDILRLMGRKEAKNTRLVAYEELEVVSKDESKLKNVKGLALSDDTSLTTLQSSQLNAMQHSLRYLYLGDWVNVDGPPCDGAFQNLRYLFVDDVHVFPFQDTSRMEQLRIFYNKSKPGIDLPQLPPALHTISHDLRNLDYDVFAKLPLQNVRSLQTILVDAQKPVKLPAGLELPASLKDLRLKNCKQLPKTFGHLTALEILNLEKCDMEVLPQGFPKLTKLAYLSLKYCTNLTSFGKGFGSLSALSDLCLNGCTRLKGLPVDFGKLFALKELDMEGCENLKALPDEFGGLSSLKKLDLTGCIKLQRLPDSFGMLSLDTLGLESLISLEQLPHSIGNLPCLTTLTLGSCHSLTSLPASFVHLQKLEILRIKKCIKLNALPNNFGQFSSLMELFVEDCPNLKELPHGFEALTALKILTLRGCISLITLPPGFGNLACLEHLIFENLMFSSLPDGFGELKRLKLLDINFCPKLEALVNEFENLCSLEILKIRGCRMLDGAGMEGLVKLQQCYFLNIEASEKLVERWKEMVRQEEEYPVAVYTSSNLSEEEWQRAARISLLCGQCIELNSSRDGLIEHPSMLLDKDTSVAVIGLPYLHHQLLQRVVGMAIETISTASLGQFRIICVKKDASDGEREKGGEEESITQILKWLPQGSLAIPSTDTRRLALIKHLFFPSSAIDKVGCFMADISADDKGHQTFVQGENIGERNISEKIVQKLLKNEYPEEQMKSEEESSQNSSTEEDSQELPWYSQLLKEANIDQFIWSNNSQVTLDQLQEKINCFIACGLKTIECIKLQEVYKKVQFIDSDFLGVWFPILKNEDYGFGMYARVIKQMPWASFLHPKSIFSEVPQVVVFDKQFGTILNSNALPMIMAWGVKAYPFTEDRIGLIVSNMYTKSNLEFLLEDMDFLGPQRSKGKKESLGGKLVFLYAEPPSKNFKLKSKLEQLVQAHEDFEILYVGHFCSEEQQDVKELQKLYEDVTQTMQWSKLSFWDMIMFWCRCKYMLNEEEEQLNKCLALQKILKHLYIEKRWLVLLDSDGVVTSSGNEVVDMICKSNNEDTNHVDKMIKEGLIDSLKKGKCNQMIKMFFKDELSNIPLHPQHPLFLRYKEPPYCDVCYSSYLEVDLHHQRMYSCKDCDWDMCRDCWEVLSKKQVQNLTHI